MISVFPSAVHKTLTAAATITVPGAAAAAVASALTVTTASVHSLLLLSYSLLSVKNSELTYT